MKITPFLASGIISAAFLVAVAAPSLVSAQYTQYNTMYPYYYSATNYGYMANGSMTSTVSTPYWCGAYWTSQPCTYSYSNSATQYQVNSYTYGYQTQPQQYQNYGYSNQSYWNSTHVCPQEYYLWGKICWVNPSNNSQFFYSTY